MSSMITLKSPIDGFEFDALHADPEGSRRGGVVVIQEIFGLDPYIRKDVARWAALGFEVIAPSMFDRQQRGFVASHDEEGFATGVSYAVANGFDNAVADVQACIDALKDNGPVLLVGYCYGGAVTWHAAARASGLTAASCYYGRGIADAAGMEPACPTICHFGARDPFIPVAEDVVTIRSARPEVPVYVYENSGHGFNNEGVDADPADVVLARQRTLQLFEEAAFVDRV